MWIFGGYLHQFDYFSRIWTIWAVFALFCQFWGYFDFFGLSCGYLSYFRYLDGIEEFLRLFPLLAYIWNIYIWNI